MSIKESHSTAVKNNPTTDSQNVANGPAVGAGSFFKTFFPRKDLLKFGAVIIIGLSIVFYGFMQNAGSVEKYNNLVVQCNDAIKNASILLQYCRSASPGKVAWNPAPFQNRTE